MKRKPSTALVVVIIVLVLLTAVALRVVRVASRRGAAPPYSTAQVTRGTLVVTVDGTGTLVPVSRQDAVTASGGKVEKILVQPGQAVKAGETLLVLSNDSLSDQVGQARLELRLARIDLEAMTKPAESLATEADIATARAAVDAARLAADRARENVDSLSARAPFAGRVSGLTANVGDKVPPGAPLFTVVTPDSLKATLMVPEADLKYIAVGDTVTVTVSAVPRDLHGRVASIAAQGSPGDRGVFYPVTVTLDDSDPRTRGGMSVTARIGAVRDPVRDEVVVNGTLAYARTETVVSPTGGTVTAVLAHEDEAVAAGQVVLALESEDAQAALSKAEADLARAEENLRQLTNPGPPAFTQDQIAKQRLRAEEAALRLAGLERQLGDLSVKADFAGTVTDVFVSPGEEVSPGRRLVSVADLSAVEAVITVDELKVAGLAAGQPATVRLDALPGESFTGSVKSVSLEGVSRDGVTSYEVHITCPGDPRMRAGMSLSASVEVARHENVLLIPAEAVYGAGAEAAVRIPVAGKPESRPVTAGLSNGVMTEILGGLSEGETVVTGSLEAPANPFERARQPKPPGTGGGD